MAKSLRSKRKRMLRRVKRERYGVKELIRLKKMLGIPVTEPDLATPSLNVIEYSLKSTSQPEVKEEPVDVQKCINFVFTDKGNFKVVDLSDEEMNGESEVEHKSKDEKHKSKEDETKMDHSQRKVYNPITMRDEDGKYPAWFTQKDIKNQAKKEKLKKQIMKKQERLKAVALKRSKKNKKLRFRRKKKTEDVAIETTEKVTEQKSNIVEQSTDEKQSMKVEAESTEQKISE